MSTHLRNGVIGGLALAFVHLCWIAVVSLGLGQPLLEFIFKIHMLSFNFQVQPFNAGFAAILLAVTFALGFVMGVVIGVLRKTIRPA